MNLNAIHGRGVMPQLSRGGRRVGHCHLEAVALWLLLALCARAGETRPVEDHLPPEVRGMHPVGRLPPSRHLDLTLGLALRNQEALRNLLQQLYDSASPQYRQFLTAEQFTAQFGPSPQDYQMVTTFAQTNGFTVTGTPPNRLLLNVNATVADIEAAFHVNLCLYWHPVEQRKFYAADVQPTVDASVPMIDVTGLNDYSLPTSRVQATPLAGAPAVVPNAGSGPGGTYLGNDFRAAYLPDASLTGSGQTVGVLEFDGYRSSDISYYERLAGLPSVTLSNVLLEGFNGQPFSSGGQLEVSLDIEVAIAMAPGLAKVIIYEENPTNGDWHVILNRMATDNLARQLSCSWYSPGLGADPVAEQIFQQMAAQGQSFFNASGDSDAFTQGMPFPGDSPHITQVGGTQLTTTGPGGAWVSETVWNEGTGLGSGGGISTNYLIPSWQANVNMTANQGSSAWRNTPDVALTATNVYVRSGGASYTVRGTSCAAPLWAGFTGLANQLALSNGAPVLGFLNPALYALGQGPYYTNCLHDITTGNNTSASSPNQFFAVAGYDLCTGWGTPAGKHLLNALAPPPRPVFQSVWRSGAALLLTWSAVQGQTYQLAYRTNLQQTTWTSLGVPLAATNTTFSASDSIGPDVTRFYRAVWVP